MPRSTADRLRTGSTPGNPRHTGQTWEFGGRPNAVLHPQNIFDAVRSCACTSRPMTDSNGISERLAPFVVFVFCVSRCARTRGADGRIGRCTHGRKVVDEHPRERGGLRVVV